MGKSSSVFSSLSLVASQVFRMHLPLEVSGLIGDNVFNCFFKFKQHFFSFFYIPTSFPSLPLFSSPPFSYLAPSPSAPPPSPFKKRQASHGLIQSMAHQIEAGPSSSPSSRQGQAIQHGGQVIRSKV